MTPQPHEIVLLTPAGDGKLGLGYCMGLTLLLAQRRIDMPLWLGGCSDVGLARNKLLHRALQGPWQHFMWIDADIGFSLIDWQYLWEGDEEAVCAEYRKKDQTRKVRVPWGLGFARVSRRLIEAMDALVTEEGVDVVARFREDGEEWKDYFPAGVVTGHRRGEDHNFWLFAQLTGLPMRIERRTRLMHTGEAHFPYRAEDFPNADSPYSADEPAYRTVTDGIPDPTEI